MSRECERMIGLALAIAMGCGVSMSRHRLISIRRWLRSINI